MRLITKMNNGQLRCSITDYNEKFRDVFRVCFYNENEGEFYKEFPGDYKYIMTVAENFLRHGEEMFHQLGRFVPVPWEQGLERFCAMMESQGIDWWLTGSCACCLRGINLDPHDIDIMVRSEDVPKITDLFHPYLFEPILDTKGWLTKDFGVLFLGVRIDIASDPKDCLDDPLPVDCGPAAQSHLERVNWKGFQIKVPPLEYQVNANRLRGRTERAELIECYSI